MMPYLAIPLALYLLLRISSYGVCCYPLFLTSYHSTSQQLPPVLNLPPSLLSFHFDLLPSAVLGHVSEPPTLPAPRIPSVPCKPFHILSTVLLTTVLHHSHLLFSQFILLFLLFCFSLLLSSTLLFAFFLLYLLCSHCNH